MWIEAWLQRERRLRGALVWNSLVMRRAGQTFTDHADVRPTLHLTGLSDDYGHDGRAIVEALDESVRQRATLSRLAAYRRSTRDRTPAQWWPSPQTYAATAETCSSVSCAPPSGGMGARYCFGCGTPSLMIFSMLW